MMKGRLAMSIREEYKAGDVVQYDDGRLDYLIEIPEQNGFWVNACNPTWIEDGRRSFCEECYPFFSDRLYDGATVVGHFRKGTVDDARKWYAENRSRYRG